MPYYLTSYELDNSDPEAGPHYRAIGQQAGLRTRLIRLGPPDNISISKAVIWCESDPRESGMEKLADVSDDVVPQTVLTRWGNAIGVTFSATRFNQLMFEIMGVHARLDGTRWRPIRAPGGVYRISMGHTVIEAAQIAGGSGNVLDLAHEVARYRINKWPILKVKERYHVSDRYWEKILRHACCLLGPSMASGSDDFNDGTLTGWTTILGTWVESDGVLNQTSSDQSYIRRTSASDLDTDAHYMAIQIVTLDTPANRNGPCVRYTTDADPNHDCQGCGIETTPELRIFEVEDGSSADLTTGDAVSHTDGDYYKCEVEDDDELRGYQDTGSGYNLITGPVTDTTGQGRTIVGLRARRRFDEFDNAEWADLAAGGALSIPVAMYSYRRRRE